MNTKPLVITIICVTMSALAVGLPIGCGLLHLADRLDEQGYENLMVFYNKETKEIEKEGTMVDSKNTRSFRDGD